LLTTSKLICPNSQKRVVHNDTAKRCFLASAYGEDNKNETAQTYPLLSKKCD